MFVNKRDKSLLTLSLISYLSFEIAPATFYSILDSNTLLSMFYVALLFYSVVYPCLFFLLSTKWLRMYQYKWTHAMEKTKWQSIITGIRT